MVFEAMRDAGCEDAAGCMMFGTNPFEDKKVADTLGIDFKYTSASNYVDGFFDYWKENEWQTVKLTGTKNVSVMPSQSSKGKMRRGRF